MTSHSSTFQVLTFVPGDGGDVPCRRRQAKDMSSLNPSLCLHVVLKGAVNPRWQIGHIASLEDQLWREHERDDQCKINGRTWRNMDCYKIWHGGLMGVVEKGSEAWVWVCMTGTGIKERELVWMGVRICSRYWEVNVYRADGKWWKVITQTYMVTLRRLWQNGGC